MFSLEWRRRVKLVCTHRRCVLGFGRASLSLAAIWWSDCRVTRCVHVCCARERYLFHLLDSTGWNYVVIFLLFGGGVAKEILSSFLHSHTYARPLAVISFDLIVSNTPQHSNYILINLSRMLFEEARSSHRCLSDYSWPSPLIIFTSKNASYGSIRGEWMSFWSDTTASRGATQSELDSEAWKFRKKCFLFTFSPPHSSIHVDHHKIYSFRESVDFMWSLTVNEKRIISARVYFDLASLVHLSPSFRHH